MSKREGIEHYKETGLKLRWTVDFDEQSGTVVVVDRGTLSHADANMKAAALLKLVAFRVFRSRKDGTLGPVLWALKARKA